MDASHPEDHATPQETGGPAISSAQLSRKDSPQEAVRRTLMFIVVVGIGIAGTWYPCHGSRSCSLLFYGCGMLQAAGVKTPWHDEFDPSAVLEVPGLFQTRFMSFAVHLIGLVSFVVEIIAGFKHHAWPIALTLWIPPLISAGFIFPRRNPFPPFFVGLSALVVSWILFAAT